jgi:hypothetical protein
MKIFPTFYGTERHIQGSPLLVPIMSDIEQFIPRSSSSRNYVLMLCSHLRFGFASRLFASGIPTKILALLNEADVVVR